MSRFTSVVVTGLLSGGLCLGAPLSSPAAGHDEAARVRATVDGLIAADNARDLEGVLRNYAEEAVLLPPTGPPVRGRQAIAPRYRTLFETHEIELEVEIEELEVSGNLAWCRGVTRGAFRALADGSRRTVNDTYLMILERSSEGAWRVKILMWRPSDAAAERD